MLSLSTQTRKKLGKDAKALRKKGFVPAVLYGPKTKNIFLKIDLKKFNKIYKQAGESSLISLEIDKKKLPAPVLIYNVQFNPVSGEPIHIDFFQPSLEEKIETAVALAFEGISKAAEELGGTLVKNISEVEVKALPQNLPHEIKVDISKLETFDDEILIKDLRVPEGVEILKKPEEIIAIVSPPEKIEEELEKPIEEKVEEVERVEEKEKEEVERKEEKKEKEETQ
jgi:large subunit ribosomal protein L25